jgi:hypothetical protein
VPVGFWEEDKEMRAIWKNPEEKRVIENSETEVANKLGEGVRR